MKYLNSIMKKIAASIVILSYLALTQMVAAAANAPTPCDPSAVDCLHLNEVQQGKGLASTTSLNTIIRNATSIVFALAALLVLVMLIWGAVSWILSGGDKDRVGNARKMIVNALIGLALLGLAFVIVRIVGGILGFDIFTNFQINRLDTGP